MREVRRYSNKTVKLAAKRVRRAARLIKGSWAYDRGLRVELLVAQLARQGLEPVDIVRPSGADALVAIASVLDPHAERHRAIDTEYRQLYGGRHVSVDSCSMHEAQIAAQLAQMRPPPPSQLSVTWQRVVDCARQMPGGLL